MSERRRERHSCEMRVHGTPIFRSRPGILLRSAYDSPLPPVVSSRNRRTANQFLVPPPPPRRDGEEHGTSDIPLSLSLSPELA